MLVVYKYYLSQQRHCIRVTLAGWFRIIIWCNAVFMPYWLTQVTQRMWWWPEGISGEGRRGWWVRGYLPSSTAYIRTPTHAHFGLSICLRVLDYLDSTHAQAGPCRLVSIKRLRGRTECVWYSSLAPDLRPQLSSFRGYFIPKFSQMRKLQWTYRLWWNNYFVYRVILHQFVRIIVHFMINWLTVLHISWISYQSLVLTDWLINVTAVPISYAIIAGHK